MTDKEERQKQSSATGSLESSEPVFLAVGKIHRPHGLAGEISMEVLTDFPERLLPGIQLYLGESHLPVRLAKTRWHRDRLLVTLEGYHTPEAVGEFRNNMVYVFASDRPVLEKGEYYHHELIGLAVFDENKRHLGRIEVILETGSNDVLVVRLVDQSEFLLPYLDSLVIKVDLERRELHTRLLPGLLGED